MNAVGIGISLGPQLMAEIGDIKRFSHKGALTAYAGVDPEVNQSGMYNQISTRTTKLPQTIIAMIRKMISTIDNS